MKKTRRVVVAAFDKFYSAESPFSDGKLKLKYLEIAEKSSLLECHRYQAEIVSICANTKFLHPVYNYYGFQQLGGYNFLSYMSSVR